MTKFVVLLPGVGDDTAARRALELEGALDVLDVPVQVHAVYFGASVVHVTRGRGELWSEMFRRAEGLMTARKRERWARRTSRRGP